MKKRLRLKKLKGDIWNLKPVLTDVELNKIAKEYTEDISTLDDGNIQAVDMVDMPCVCRDIERMIIEKLQNRLKQG